MSTYGRPVPLPLFSPLTLPSHKRKLTDGEFTAAINRLARDGAEDPELFDVVALAASPLPDIGNDDHPARLGLDDDLERKIAELMDEQESDARRPLRPGEVRARRTRTKLGPSKEKTPAEEALARLFKANRTRKLIVYPQERRVLTASGQVLPPATYAIVQAAFRARPQRRTRASSTGGAAGAVRPAASAAGRSAARRNRR